MARMELPAEALDWLAVWRGVRGLVLAGDLGLPRRLTAAGHTLFALTDDVTLAGRLGALDKVTPLVARPEAIPADPCQFEVAFAHQNLHRFDLSQALPQLARVLRPGGCLSASYLVRDDTVPWVRRLAALLRRYDPMAMRGDYGDDSVEALLTSKYFPEADLKSFRVWQSVNLRTLLGMVAAQPAMAALDEDLRQLVLADAEALYHQASPAADDLRLPYELKIWRAWVDHEELTAPIEIDDSGLVIPL